jgi:hypothetical protein
MPVIVHRMMRGGTLDPSYSVIAHGGLDAPSLACAGADTSFLLVRRLPDRELWCLRYDGQVWLGEAEPRAPGILAAQASAGSDTPAVVWLQGDAAPYQIETRQDIASDFSVSRCWEHARTFLLSGHGSTAYLEASLGPCVAVGPPGVISGIPLCDTPGDFPGGYPGAISFMRTRPFALDELTDSVRVSIRVDGRNARTLCASDRSSVVFRIVRWGSGDVLGTFARSRRRDLDEGSAETVRMTIPVSGIRPLAGTDSLVIRIDLEEIPEEGLRAAMVDRYTRGCTLPVRDCTGHFEEFTTDVQKPAVDRGGVVLRQNYPNPFNATTTIEYELPAAGAVRLEVFNMIGQRVLDPGDIRGGPGAQAVALDASGLASGAYLYRLTFEPVAGLAHGGIECRSAHVALGRFLVVK